MKTKHLSVFLVVIFSLSSANAEMLCSGKTTRELEACAKSNYELYDKKLNDSYQKLTDKLTNNEKNNLVDAERSWVKYKEAICQGAFDATSPGAEAGIDKLSCLIETTRARIREINYIASGIGGDEFRHAADIVAKIYENGDREKFIEKLIETSKTPSDSNWSAYVKFNCQLATSRLHEEYRDCSARQNFYRY